MSSGRSARLPTTPTTASTNKSRLLAGGEQNSNNVLHCSGTGNSMMTFSDSNESAISGASISIGLGRSTGSNIIQPSTATETMLEENELSMATSQVLENLSDNERKMIIEVLNRDENVRQRDATRIMLLRAELYSLRRRGTLKIGNTFNGGTQHATQQILENNQNLPPTHPMLHESNRHCARCNTELGRITNRGAPCRVCKLRVCKTCREFTTRTTDWVCVVCHKQIEIQANTGEWLNELTRDTCGLADQDNLRKSIRRSWTISNPEEDSSNPNPQQLLCDNLYPQQQNLMEAQSAGSYPSLIRHQTPSSHQVNYHSGSAIAICGIGLGSTPQMSDYHVNPQRRVLRQSTLPNSLSKNDSNLTGSGANLNNYNCVNLTAPTSPHQMQKNPLYPNAYNSDDIIQMNTSIEGDNYVMQSQPQLNIQTTQQKTIVESTAIAPTHSRLQVRRQSTLPANPGQTFIYNSTSPNRMYSRSPERSPGEQRYPPFMRQTSFPCNIQEPMSQQHLNVGSNINNLYSSSHRGKLLPQQPHQSVRAFENPAPAEEVPQSVMKSRMMRQATLPNPEQHVKLLPTSPPKRQTSPQYRRSPEFMRQQTLPNPEAFSGNSLSVHPPGVGQAKFMPISPRQKQNFLFPSNPRPFLSQQNVPFVGITEGGNEEHYSSSQSVNTHHNRDHAKMMKVRSHSNEEYSITKPYPSEGRRLLPEIPTNRSATRSPSRLVRQDCLKDDRSTLCGSYDTHARTFIEAKQQFSQFEDVTEENDTRPEYADYFGNQGSSFLEADEVQYEKAYNAGVCSEPRIIYNDGTDDGSYNQIQRTIIHSSENILANESLCLYNIGDPEHSGNAVLCGTSGPMSRSVQIHNRLRRRLSREIQMQQDQAIDQIVPSTYSSNTLIRDGTSTLGSTRIEEAKHDRRKPEQMRSVSEDSGVKSNVVKPVTRRSLSHPENESKNQKKFEPTNIPSPKPLADILDKTRQTKIPAPIRRNSKGCIGADATEDGNVKHYMNDRRNSNITLKANRKQEPICHDKKNDQPEKQEQKRNAGTTNYQTEKACKSNSEEDMVNQSNIEIKSENVETDVMKTISTTATETTSSKTHTTTLGEQEIQNAVEAAAVLFKKVVLQRRQEKKAAEQAPPFEIENLSELDIKSLTVNHNYYHVDADEFKLVYLNSDSSTLRDDEFEDRSSTASSSHNCSSVTIDECDWDYFEPSMLSNPSITNHQILYSPLTSPLSQRRCISRDVKSTDSTTSPMDSPLFYRKKLLLNPRSDTGTDDEMQGESSSQTSSDSYLTKSAIRHQQQMNIKTRIKTRLLGKDNRNSHYSQGNSVKMEEYCKSISSSSGNMCTCGASINANNVDVASPNQSYQEQQQPQQQLQYVPIPVPMPFPVPMAAFHNWNPNIMVPSPINEEGDLCASIQKLWGTNLSEQSTSVSSNLHAAVVAAYSNSALLDVMPQNCAEKMLQIEKSVNTTTKVNKPVLNVGLRSFASVELAAAGINQSHCLSSGYETAATGGSLEMLHCNETEMPSNRTALKTTNYKDNQLKQLLQNTHHCHSTTDVYRTRPDQLEFETELARDVPVYSRIYLCCKNKHMNKKPTTMATAESDDNNSDSYHEYRRKQKQQQQQQHRQADQLNQQSYVSVANVNNGFLNVECAVPGTPMLVPVKPSSSLSRDCAPADCDIRAQAQKNCETNGNETTPTSLEWINQQALCKHSFSLAGAHNELSNKRASEYVFHKNNNFTEADDVSLPTIPTTTTLPPPDECDLIRNKTTAASVERPLQHTNKKHVCDRSPPQNSLSTIQTASQTTKTNTSASNNTTNKLGICTNNNTGTTTSLPVTTNTQAQQSYLLTTEQQRKSPQVTENYTVNTVGPFNKQRLSNTRITTSANDKGNKIAKPESKVRILGSITESTSCSIPTIRNCICYSRLSSSSPAADNIHIGQYSCTCTAAVRSISLEKVKQTENTESIYNDINKVLVKVYDNESTSVYCEQAPGKDVENQLFSSKHTAHSSKNSMITIEKLEKPSADGYLQSENVFVSSECSESDSENQSVSGISASDDDCVNQVPSCSSVLDCVQKDEMHKKYVKRKCKRSRRAPLQRTYEFGAVALREKLISSSKGNVSNTGSTGTSSSSMSSSESVDSEDTGTIADCKPKKRHFSKVFVVNRNESSHHRHVVSSTENDSLSSDANLEDSSDNDTDIERTDCGIVLNYVKTLGEENAENLNQVYQGEDTLDPSVKENKIKQQESECDDYNDVYCSKFENDGDDDERYVGTATEEIANCIIVVGGITDNTNSDVVLNSMRNLGDDELDYLPSDHGTVYKKVSNAISSHLNGNDNKRNSISKKHTKESEQLESARNIDVSIASRAIVTGPGGDVKGANFKPIDTADACEELHTIANDVNRLLSLTKQNSGLEFKLQKLRRDVEEINQDHLPKATVFRPDCPIESRKVVRGTSLSSEDQSSVCVNALMTANTLQTGIKSVLCAAAETALEGGERREVDGKKMHNEFANKTHHKHEEITKVDILANKRTSEHERSMIFSYVFCEGRGDIGGGAGMWLANEQVFGVDKVDSQYSTNSNDELHRTKQAEQEKPIYNVLNDDHNEDETSDDWEKRTSKKMYDSRGKNHKVKTPSACQSNVVVVNYNSKKGNGNITEIKSKQCEEEEEKAEKNEQHRKQVNTAIYTLAITSGHEQHTNNEMVNHHAKRQMKSEQTQQQQQRQTQNEPKETREEQNQRLNEACKTNELTAEYFMDLERQTQTEVTTTIQMGELTESEHHRKTPESEQVANKVNGNKNINNNSELKSVRVVVIETINTTKSNNKDSYVRNSNGNEQAVCAETRSETETVVSGLAKPARAVKNEMLNDKGETQLSDVFGVEIGAVAVDDVNGNNNSGSSNASIQNLREQIATGERRTNTAIQKKEFISTNMFESLNNDEKCKNFNKAKNNNYNNYQMSCTSIDDFEDNDDENEILNYENDTNLNIRESVKSDNSARMLDTYAPFYSDISSSGTPNKKSSPNSLSSKYRSLTMIKKDTDVDDGKTLTVTETTTPQMLSNTSIVNTSRVVNDSTNVSGTVYGTDIGGHSNVVNLNYKFPSHVNRSDDPNRPARMVNPNVNDPRQIIFKNRPHDSFDKSSSYSYTKNTDSTITDTKASGNGDNQLESVLLLQKPKISYNDADHVDGIYVYNEQSACKNKTPIVCIEDGLADDDSWVGEISQNEDDVEDISTPTASDSEDMSVDDDDSNSVNSIFIDHEEELRGYHRSAIDFTLHTIVEESCEESEVASLRYTEDEDLDDMERRRQRSLNHHNRLSASDLEKYFFFGLGDGKLMSSIDTRGDDTASEVSSECSDGIDSLGIPEEAPNQVNSAAELASSRLEKYFLSGFMGFNGNEKGEFDESGSVGSDSEGHPSPSQRRKRLVRARGTPRSHNSSLDNLLVDTQIPGNDTFEAAGFEMGDSSESDVCDETVIHVDKAAESSTSDTIKRKKQLRKRHDSIDDKKHPDSNDECNKITISTSECRTPTPGSISIQTQVKNNQHHSRDSGFVGSNDDLLKSSEGELNVVIPMTSGSKPPSVLEQINELSQSPSTSKKQTIDLTGVRANSGASSLHLDGGNKKPPLQPTNNATLVRRDSFNNWSSDEETNLMMSKMRQFFKTLVVATANAQQNYSSSNSNSKAPSPNQTTPISVRRMKSHPPQLAYFENELTRLMKTVPGINDEQVRELVEYLSSEDTWSDSYDSSDYNSSDLEGSNRKKCELKEQISASCQRIINKFEVDEEGDRGDGGLLDETHALNVDTALVYQKLVASFSKIAVGNTNNSGETNNVAKPKAGPFVSSFTDKPLEEDCVSTNSNRSAERSPQLFAKVMQHIGTRLVALMHEVNSGNDSHGTNSPLPTQRLNHKRLQAKISITTTEDEEESQSESDHVKSTRAHPTGVGIGTQNHVYPHHHHTQAQQKVNKQIDDAKKLARSKSHDVLLDVASCPSVVAIGISTNTISQPHHHQSSSGVSDTAGEEYGVASDYERFSWRGSFESALLANNDSRTKLSQLDRDNLSSASALAIAKRRSAGDLLFNHKSLSREQLDRVRSCGSIGGGDERHHELEASPAKPWVSSTDSRDVRRSSVPDAIYESDSSVENAFGARSTLPRMLSGVTQVASTNSLPRLSTTGIGSTSTPTQMTKSQGALNYVPSVVSAKSARYRSPGLSGRANSLSNNKSSSSIGLQNFLYSKRDARKRLSMSAEEAKFAAKALNRSPVIGQRSDLTCSPIHSRGSASSDTWPAQSDEDIDRLVAMHQNRSSFSSLGLRSDSMASVYSGAGEGRYGTVIVKGHVEFGMQYNYKLSCLEIHVVKCKDLAAVDVKRNRSDPYVKVYLLPDKSKSGKRKTKVKKHTLNPIFDEVLRFHMPISSLESRTLWLSVWHSDMFGRNDFLGEVTVNLHGKVFDNPQSQWYPLQERSEPFDEIASYRGDIVVGLKFIPPENSKAGFSRGSVATGSNSNLRKFGSLKSVTTKSDRTSKGGQLHVLVKEAKHLSPIKANGSCDAFCKSYLLPDRTRSSKQKTPVVKRSLHPSWNYTFVYEDVSLEDLSERALELTVWDHDRLASNEFIGGVRFSLGTGKSYGRLVDWMDASGKELSLWQNMLNRPNFWVEGSLVLKSTLDGVRAMT